MRQKIEMKKERIAIRVTTLPNGYSVDLEKENFMYYSPKLYVLFANGLAGRVVCPCGHEP